MTKSHDSPQNWGAGGADSAARGPIPQNLPLKGEGGGHCVALAGGVGGAKLAYGLARVVPADQLTLIVNTADDFELYGLHISPDLDTVMYTLAGIANPATGWGVAGDTFEALAAIGRYGQETWFRLGDRDLATHILRTAMLRQGRTLTAVTQTLSRALGVEPKLLPMTDNWLATIIETDEGDLEFQDYFVRRRWQPVVRGIRFAGLGTARPTPEVLAALDRAGIVILCPSNPLVSIDPILALPGVRERLQLAHPVVAVSPIVGGQALKGPAAKMLAELGQEVSAYTVAAHYADFLDGFVLDQVDAAEQARIAELGLRVLVTNTVMQTDADKIALAERVLEFAAQAQHARV